MINIAQIGLGYWGPNIMRALIGNKRCSLKTVVELSRERREFAKSVSDLFHVTDNIEQVLEDGNIDAVVIATPVVTHFPLVLKFLNAGKHVLVEKPMATSVKEVDELSVVAKNKSKVSMVGHTFLYNDAVKFLKKLIESPEFGCVRYIYSQRLNLGRIRTDVDALWNLAPHDISIFQYLLNDPVPVSVSRHGMDFIQPGIEDVSFITIKYPGKILAHSHVSWLDPNKTRKVTVVGSKKMVVYDDVAEDKIIVYDKGIDPVAQLGHNMDFDASSFREFYHRSGDIFIPKISYTEPLKNEINHFFDCIEGKSSCLTGTEHAREVIRILEAASR